MIFSSGSNSAPHYGQGEALSEPPSDTPGAKHSRGEQEACANPNEEADRGEQTERTRLLWGAESVQALRRAHLLVVGVGGVGGEATLALARAGVGAFTLVDGDAVSPSNLNRQAVAFAQTVGSPKTEVMKQLILQVNPAARVETIYRFITPEEIPALLAAHPYAFVLDAIDTLTPKCVLLAEAQRLGLPVISSMGAGAKDNPEAVRVAPLSASHSCALAKAVRKRLREMQAPITFPCVFSTQPAIPQAVHTLPEVQQGKRTVVGTVSYMPALFGLRMAAYVLQTLTQPYR